MIESLGAAKLSAFTPSFADFSAPKGMVWIEAGQFTMGCATCDMPDALPLHKVELSGFWLDQTPVTNADFAKFIAATSYKTIAERPLNPDDFPGANPQDLVPGSSVFTPPLPFEGSLRNKLSWWRYVPAASWQHPEGAQSNIASRQDHPVVHVAWDDAMAYCQWRGKRLPSESEFEFAARSGLEGRRYSWGDELKPAGRWLANIWQGDFPVFNAGEDGYQATSPVKAFPANSFGLYDMAGNVWQWCADWYRADYYQALAKQGLARNPTGPTDSFDPLEPGVAKRVQKGGSFLCSEHACRRFLVGSRGKGAVDSGSSNVGFRCALSAQP